MADDMKQTLQSYLQFARDAVLWKLDGLSEYDMRRPLTPTGTNLLGLVKHLALVEVGLLGGTFGRPFPEAMPWGSPDAELNADMWATADESSAGIVDRYRRVWTHSDATIDALDLESPGTVPHWSEPKKHVTLHRILVHMTTETHRHAGHADIVRELVDGAAGLLIDNDNMATDDDSWWAGYRQRVEDAARQSE